MSVNGRSVACATILLALPLSLRADTLHLRDGSRIQGELISVRNGTIEFEERRGFGGGRTLRLDRNEVLRIEFDDRGGGNIDNGFGGGGRPSGMRERQVIVSADVGWNDTGVDVRAGQTVYFSATGQVRWGKDRRDGPEGENHSPSNPNRPMPNRNAAALIGRIGSSSSDMFYIGNDSGPIRVRSSGRLFLGVNDDFLQDNTGNFRVVVYY
jgi:hypothetical protein